MFKYINLLSIALHKRNTIEKCINSKNRIQSIMDGYKQEIALIKKVLKENPKGMTVTDISRKIKVNRNSVAKYLDIMRISGQVEMITFGPAKVFFPSKRVPLNNILNYTSDYILIFDSNYKIKMINDTFLEFVNAEREELINKKIESSILNFFDENLDIKKGIKKAINGEDFVQEIDCQIDEDNVFLKVKIIPISFDDGKHGVAFIIQNYTDHKMAENALRETEQKFRSFLNKIDKK